MATVIHCCIDHGESPILWLSGSKASKKSTFSQTMAESLANQNKLAASFFISPPTASNVTCSYEAHFAASIAIQLIQTIPAIRPYIEHAIIRNPTVFDLITREQARLLILQPLEQLRKDHPGTDTSTLPRIIVVDALDECSTQTGQLQILDALDILISRQDIFPFFVFLSCRHEQHICSWFSNRAVSRVGLLPCCCVHCNDCNGGVFLPGLQPEMRCHRQALTRTWTAFSVIARMAKRCCNFFDRAIRILQNIMDTGSIVSVIFLKRLITGGSRSE
ncbi:hypothetical protein BJ165DRAFT_1482920 [Panaeolus papilionaceus]|nr:hypothetical protein BJ165DRAFT_1482920 [Panaeolus papilionaceus]